MRNGEQYDPLAYTCAVDAEAWERLQGKALIVNGVRLEVTDSGWLGEGNLDLTPAAFTAVGGDLEDGVVFCVIEGG